jgi:hypothetical protein
MSSDPPAYSDWSGYGTWPEPGHPAGPAETPRPADRQQAGAPQPPGEPGEPARHDPGPGETGPTETGPSETGPGGRPPGRGWRFLISPRWLGWHALMIVLVIAMLALGDWQLRRAEAGNALSWAYTFEWPIFAGFAVVFWAKTIKDEFRPPAWPEWTYSQDTKLPSGAMATRQGTEPDGDEEEDSELADYNAYLARLAGEVKGHGKWHGLR